MLRRILLAGATAFAQLAGPGGRAPGGLSASTRSR
jgi:hypothetical protein